MDFAWIRNEATQSVRAYASAWAREVVDIRGVKLVDTIRGRAQAVRLKMVEEISGVPQDRDGRVDVTTLRGFATWNKIHDTFEKFKVREVGYQVEFRERILRAMLPHIYQEDWDEHANAICAYHDVKKLYPFVSMISARQVGKSATIAWTMAAVATACAGIRFLIISKGQRQSINVRSLFRKALETAGYTDTAYYPIDNQETVHFSRSAGRVPGDVCTFKFVPGVGDNARGEPFDVALVDEGGFVHPNVFKAMIFPLMGVSKAVCVVTSSPPPDACTLTRLLDLTDDDGQPLVDVLYLNAMCDECVKAQRDDCPHNEDAVAPWRQGRQELVSKLYGASDFSMLAREAGGVLIADARPVFRSVFIDAIDRISTHHTFQEPVENVILSIDPSGGGSYSQFAAVLITIRRAKSPAFVVRFPLRVKCVVRSAPERCTPVARRATRANRRLCTVVQKHVGPSIRSALGHSRSGAEVVRATGLRETQSRATRWR